MRRFDIFRVFIFLFIAGSTSAQPFFNWEYHGPDTIQVGTNCRGTLNWGGDANVVVTPINPDIFIVNKGLRTISGGYTIGSSVDAGVTVTITYEALDFLGNYETFSFTIYFADLVPPAFTPGSLPPDITIACVANLPQHSITATDNCTPAFQINISVSINFPPQPCEGVYERVWTATDNAGNQTHYTQLVTLTPETTPPSITTPAADVFESCDIGTADQLFQEWIDSQGGAVAADNCGIYGWTTLPANPVFNPDCSVPNTVTFIVSDFCGNTASTTATFQISDTIDPVVTVEPEDMFASCSDDASASLETWLLALGNAEVADNCVSTSELIIQYQYANEVTTLTELQQILQDQLALPCKDTTINGQAYNNVRAVLEIEFIIADACQNSVTATALFIVSDTTAPTILTPGTDTTEVTCQLTELPTILTNWFQSGAGATAEDLCGDVVWQGIPDLNTILQALENNSLCDQEFSVLFTPVDACGNVGSDAFTSVFRISDVDGPEFTTPAQNYLLVCSSATGVQDTLEAWINNYAGAAIEDCNTPAWKDFSWTDNEGNVGSGEFGTGPYPVVSGNGCGQFINVVFKATDACMNESTDTARFDLGDSEPPIAANMPQDTTILCGDDIQMNAPSFTDNCGLDGSPTFTETSTQNPNTQDCGHYQYTITRTWTAVDACANSTQVSQLITVIDTLAPQPDMIFSDTTISCDQNIDDLLVNFTDNCSEATIEFQETTTQSTDPADCAYYNYTITQTYIVNDFCNNTAQYSRNIFVVDTTAPVLVTDDTLVLNCLDSNIVLIIIGSLASDNCAAQLDIQVVKIMTNSDDCSQGLIQHWLLTATDPCGNTRSDTVIVMTIDNTPPDITQPAQAVQLFCSDTSNVEDAFQDWLTNLGGAIATDICGVVNGFAAIPGSYDITDETTFPGILPDFQDAEQCTGDAVLSITVDFVFYDLCGNASVTTSTFVVSDSVAPVILYHPADIEIIIPGDCEAAWTPLAPGVYDACFNASFDSTLVAEIPVISLSPGHSLTIVEPVSLTFGPLSNQHSFATFGSGILLVEILNGDTEAATEYFDVYSEDGELLGQTGHAAAQCEDASTEITFTEAMFEHWAADGYIHFMLVPNDPTPLDGGHAINDICGGTIARGTLGISRNTNNLLKYSYSIDSGAYIAYDPNAVLPVKLPEGRHQIDYAVEDCGTNIVYTSHEVFIRDTVLPAIQCPGDIAVTLYTLGCDTTLTVPLPLSITDNCGLGNDFQRIVPADTASAWLTFSHNPNLQNYIANDKQYTFTGITGNVTASVRLNIYLKGDVASGGEYFSIYDENNNLLGRTEAGPPHVLTGDCNKVSTIYFNIPAARFNEMSTDGSITFRAVSNVDFTIPPANQFSGINPCPADIVTVDGGTDSSSYMFMELVYATYNPPYYFASGATEIQETLLPPPYTAPELSFNVGTTLFHYIVEDKSGNRDTCAFEITVQDTIHPVAICQESNVYVHPSGTFTNIIYPADIDGGSSDNCYIDTMYVWPNTFTCSDIGSQLTVTLYVVDPSGLIDSCETMVRVLPALLEPQYSLGICDNDTLQLFANVPDTALFNQYTYSWTGPNGFSSALENPFIPNANASNAGTYTLRIEGFNGCYGEGTVQVFINDEINTPIIGAVDTTVCENQPITLFTQSYSGSIVYRWYEGIAPGGVLLDSTIVPEYSLTKPTGTYAFYVVIRENDCVSNPSASVNITVIDRVIAEVDNTYIGVCEGGSIALGTPLGGGFYKYVWTGPNGFMSHEQYPPVISPALPVHAGIYSLIVLQDNCASDPVTVTVEVTQKPARPTPSVTSPVCLHSDLTLTSNISQGIDSFIWKKPDGTLIVTSVNPLVIPNVGMSEHGLWTLTLLSKGCNGDESEPVMVSVVDELQITITYTGPVCTGDSVQLFATNIPGATYQWTGPGGFVSGLQNPVVVAMEGPYTVTVVSPQGCTGMVSANLSLRQRPTISNLTTTAQACHPPDELIQFSYDLNIHPDSADFMWTGPGGFQSTLPHPTVNPSLSVNGIYSVVVTSKAGCKSDTFRTTMVLTLAPEKPIIQGLNQLCSGDTLRLIVANISAPGQYIWQTPAGDVSTTTNALTIHSAQVVNGGSYSVIYNDGSCSSKPSEVFTVAVTQTPSQPVIIGDPTVCTGDTIRLQISGTFDNNYQWQGPGGLTSTQKAWVIYPAQAHHAGNYTLTLSHNGCFSEPSDAFQLIIHEPPPAPFMSDVMSTVCAAQTDAVLTLCITQNSATPGASYTFYNDSNAGFTGGPTNALCINVTDFTPFQDGINYFYAVASLNGCPSLPSIPLAVDITRPPDDIAQTVGESFVCDGNTGTLTAIPVLQATGTWHVLTSGVSIQDPTSPVTGVRGLQPGRNIFVWTLDYQDCSDYSRDTQIIWRAEAPVSVNDIVRITSGTTIDVLQNDVFNTPVTIIITSAPQYGTATITPGQAIDYIPAGNNTYDRLTYQICVTGCPDLCAEADVLIDIDDPSDCRVPNIITPNNDGINDVLRISCLDGLVNNQSNIVIFNEWGTQVHEASPYRNDWDGTYKGEQLPVGTYFFVFDRGDGTVTQKGFLIIKK